MTEKKSLWDKAASITTIIGLLVAGYAVYQTSETLKQEHDLTTIANDISQASLQLQNIISNFNITVIPYFVEADLGRFNYNGSNYLSADGSINLILVVITPHAAILNFSENRNSGTVFLRRNDTLPVGNGQYLPILDQTEYYVNQIFFFPFNTSWALTFGSSLEQKYVAFVQPGVTQVNFSLPIHGDFYLNQEYLNSQGANFAVLLSLANFSVKMKLFDIQTQNSSILEYSGTLDVWVASNYPY